MYEAGAKKLNALLDDLKWRKEDVAAEEATLKRMQDGHEECPADHFEAQEIVVRSARKVLDNEIKEAEELDAELERVKAEIEKLSKQEVEKHAEEEAGAGGAHEEGPERGSQESRGGRDTAA